MSFNAGLFPARFLHITHERMLILRRKKGFQGNNELMVLFLLSMLIFLHISCGKKGFKIQKEFPNPYVQSNGILLEDFADTSQWTLGGVSALKDRDSIIFYQGRYSLKLTSINGNVAFAYKNIRPRTFEAVRNFALWVYVHLPPDTSGDVYTKLKCIRLKFTSYPRSWESYPRGWENFMGVTIDDSLLVSGWNHLVIGKSNFIANGSESWSNKMVRVRVEVESDTKQDVSVSFDELRYDYRARAKCVIAFDDNDINQFTLAYPAMKARDMRGVCFIVCNWVGTPGRMDTTQMRTLYSNGWDISNHTMTHPRHGLPSRSDAQKRAEINGCHSWLLDHGFIKGADFFAFPEAKYDSSSIAIVKEHHKLARSMAWDFYQPNVTRNEPDVLYKLKFLYITAAGGPSGFHYVTPTMVKAQIDDAIEQGKLIILGLHSICNSPGCEIGVMYNYDSLIVILDYLQSHMKGIDVMTFSEYLRGLPRLIPQMNEVADKISDLRSLLGGCDSCYQIIYRAKGSDNVDSVLIVDPTAKPDSLVGKIILNPKRK
jgi:peptidoglycan/xylan/chitin deacetylase (PgdA/CDA1 family)